MFFYLVKLSLKCIDCSPRTTGEGHALDPAGAIAMKDRKTIQGMIAA